MSYNFLIMGGDERQLYLGKFLEDAGCNVFYRGFGEKDNFKDMYYDYIILPAPLTKDGLNINAPFSDKCLPINDIFCLADLTIHKTSLHTADRFLCQNRLWLFDFNIGKFCG